MLLYCLGQPLSLLLVLPARIVHFFLWIIQWGRGWIAKFDFSVLVTNHNL